MISLKNERGSALLENVASMSTFVLIIAAFIFFASAGIAKIWLHYAGNEAALCLASDATQATCEQEFRDRTQILELFGHMRNFQLQRSSTEAAATWDFQVSGFQTLTLDLNGNIHLRLPLVKPSSTVAKELS